MEKNISINKSLLQEFAEQSIYHISLNYPRIETCLGELNEEEVWQKPNSSSNSIGNLILHLCGNITQYILSSLGGMADNRNRDSEFEATGGFSKHELLKKIKYVSESACAVIKDLTEEQLINKYEVQGYTSSGIAIIVHVTEHYSYHTGQITLLTKLLKDIDTGYYKGIDLNKKNRI
ncbi:MAG: DinB family protein [Ignavibacteria bacterium]